MEFNIIIAAAVFLIAYIAISFDLLNKAYIALLGASILLVLKVIPVEIALTKIDLNVISILIALMVTVNVVNETGIFQYVAIKSAKLVKGDPLKIIILLMVFTALISTLLPNVAVILVIAPISVLIAIELGISPLPFLITQAIASNIGGTATLIGDPPNIMIGYKANLTFNDFLINMTPLIAIIMVFSIIATFLIFKKSLIVSNERRARIMAFDESQTIGDKVFFIKSFVVFLLIITGFLLYDVIKIDPVIISILGATILLLFSKRKPENNFSEIEWSTVFFFAGLFIMVGTLEELKIIKFLGDKIAILSHDNIEAATLIIIWGSGILSGIIDNIPFVATMIPLIKILNIDIGTSSGNVLWWALSAGACLGGNFTLIGASANIVTAGIAAKNGYKLSFMEFTKYGVIYTFISLVITTIYIFIRYLM